MAKQSGDVPVKKSADHRPTHPLMGLRQEMDRIFEDFASGWPSFRRWADFSPLNEMSCGGFTLSPNVDVSETDSAYEITAELPGISEDDIEVIVTDKALTIKGEKKNEREEKKKDYYLSERSYGAFQRSFALPDNIDVDKIGSKFDKGVLSVVMPKTAEAKEKMRKIKVESS